MIDSIVNIEESLHVVLKAVNADPAGIAFVTNNKGKLCGVVTDGDFRRLLLQGKGLNDKLMQEDLKDYVYANKGETIYDLINKTSKKVRIIPIIDVEGKPVDYFRYEHKTNFTPIAEPSLRGNELKYVTDAILSTWISSVGSYIDKFEQEFSAYCNVKHGVAVANGTVAIHLALKALNIGVGDEVIIPDLTFAATANAVILSGAKPVIVDVDENSWCIDPGEILKAISPNTKAIIPVHIYGQPCDMDAIMKIAKEHNLYVIEDAAEAHGAEYKGKKAGSFGHISCFSFFANKIITTGEGGMCLTDDDVLNEKMRKLRDHGMNRKIKYWHDEVGFNYRMTNMQAAVGCAQMERIDDILEEREALENRYIEIFKEFDFIKWQKNISGNKKVVWLVTALINTNRELFIEKFRNHNIDIRPFFFSLSEMPPFKEFSFSNQRSQRLSKMGVNFPTVSNVDFEKIVNILENE